MPDTPHTTEEENALDAGWGEDDSGVSERPTVAPPFDLESYAKENAAPSSNVVLNPERALRGGPPLPGTRVPLEQRIDRALHEPEESQSPSVRAPSDTALTMPPPPPGPEAPAAARHLTPGRPTPLGIGRAGRMTPAMGGPASDPLSRRETPQGTKQVEEARALSAREDFGTGTLLSLANMRAPSNLPPRPAPDDPVLTLVGIEDEGGASGDGAGDGPVDGGGDPLSEMQERFALGDYSGALVMAESLLEENPSHVEAREYAESCRAVLQQMYTAKIGPLDRIPMVDVARDQLRWLSIDHRAGFVLSLVDGVSSLEMILDVSGMPSLDALRILYELVEQRIISLRDAG